VESIISSDIIEEDVDEGPRAAPKLSLPIKSHIKPGDRGQPKDMSLKEQKAELRKLRDIKAKLTAAELEEIRREVEWIPYSSFFDHLASCEVCPHCMFYCKDCR